MGVYAQILTAREIAKLGKILSSLMEEKGAGDIIRTGFAGYAKRVTGKAIEPWSLSRVIRHPGKAPYERQALLYDYVCEDLAPAIAEKRFYGECSEATAGQINALLEEGKARVAPPWDIEGFGSFCSPVPKSYIKEYFGYRMSANAGSVIRFYLDIKQSDDPAKVTYRNLYRSGATTLEIMGTGRFVHGTLYLVGHATDIDHFETKGMRLMALRQVETSEKLSGIVLTADSSVLPIAARVLLVPTRMHRLNRTPDGKISRTDLKRFVLEGINDRTIPDAVETMSNLALRDISEDERSTEDTLAMFIENTTPTVLKAGNDLGFDLARLTDEMNHLRTSIPSGLGRDMARALAENMASAIEAFRKNLEGLDAEG